MNENKDIVLYDWRTNWVAKHPGEHVAILIPIGGDLIDIEGNAVDLPGIISKELTELLDEPTIGTELVDPYTGAGGYGLAVIWEIVGHGADMIAWVTAAVAAASQIRKATRYLTEKFDRSGHNVVSLTGETVKVLCVAEICESGVVAESIEVVNLIEHKYFPNEPTVEKQHFYSAYTVTIAGRQPDHFYHVWNYFVTCHGVVISRNNLKIPMPNMSHWNQAQLPKEKLAGLL